jgi:hypothetical protein
LTAVGSPNDSEAADADSCTPGELCDAAADEDGETDGEPLALELPLPPDELLAPALALGVAPRLELVLTLAAPLAGAVALAAADVPAESVVDPRAVADAEAPPLALALGSALRESVPSAVAVALCGTLGAELPLTEPLAAPL